LAEVIDRFTEVLDLKHFALLVFDYGAPVGFRIALKHPTASPRLARRTATPTRWA
jgi:pimeloyl-ACP methyl ester carboxylesterase